MKFGFFVIRIYYEKLGHMLKPTVPKFRPNSFAHLKEIAKKTGPCEAETDSNLPVTGNNLN